MFPARSLFAASLSFALAGLTGLTAGCAVDDSHLPSLAPRAGEKVDPRLPIPDLADATPADPALGARVAALVAAGRSGTGAFDAAADLAERLAAGAGASHGEGWIAAQEALSGAIVARAPLTRALSDLDALAADRIASTGALSPADQRQVASGAAVLGEIDRAQARRITAIQARIGN